MKINDENQMVNSYLPGKLQLLVMEYFNKQKTIKDKGNSINLWKILIQNYFSENCIFCMIMNRTSKEWTFRLKYDLLPLLLKLKYDENVKLLGINCGNTKEYELSNGKYLIEIKNFSKVEKYDSNVLVTEGVLRIILDENFKFEIYEFLSKNHSEIETAEFGYSFINEFGITPQFSRNLIIAECISEMDNSINKYIDKFD